MAVRAIAATAPTLIGAALLAIAMRLANTGLHLRARSTCAAVAASAVTAIGSTAFALALGYASGGFTKGRVCIAAFSLRTWTALPTTTVGATRAETAGRLAKRCVQRSKILLQQLLLTVLDYEPDGHRLVDENADANGFGPI
jgi:hypothetical protein